MGQIEPYYTTLRFHLKTKIVSTLTITAERPPGSLFSPPAPFTAHHGRLRVAKSRVSAEGAKRLKRVLRSVLAVGTKSTASGKSSKTSVAG
jgi:hypothetical protein